MIKADATDSSCDKSMRVQVHDKSIIYYFSSASFCSMTEIYILFNQES